MGIERALGRIAAILCLTECENRHARMSFKDAVGAVDACFEPIPAHAPAPCGVDMEGLREIIERAEKRDDAAWQRTLGKFRRRLIP